MKRILIVEPYAAFIRQKESMLNRADFELHVASSAEEALGLHRAKKMDLILAELNMPGMSGDELVKAIRTDHALREVSIIMVCHQRKAELERCAAAGANDYVTHPIESARLMGKVARLLDVACRKSLRVLVKVSVRGASQTGPFFGSTRNISLTGMLLETQNTLARGDAIFCSFFIPASEKIETEGEVARVVKEENTFLYGIRFLTISEADKNQIEKFAREKL